MIYNRLDFMGLPLETLIKQYRTILGKKSFGTVAEYKEDFCRYLKNDVKISSSDDLSNVATIINNLMAKIDFDIYQLISSDISSRGSYQKSKTNQIAQKYLRTKISELKSMDFANGFNRKSVPAQYVPFLNARCSGPFKLLIPNDGTKKLMHDYVGYFLSKKTTSNIRTGIVITGFGRDEFCPSLSHFEIDGVIDGKLKILEKEYVDIGRAGPHANVLGFAQDDMIKNFLNGIDPHTEIFFRNLYSTTVHDAGLKTIEALVGVGANAQAVYQALKHIYDQMSSEIYEKTGKFIESSSTTPILQMITHMPKQELATLAASLIEITSLKRKVTRVQETVGGEVDVAIISKAEGFVWIKRKHYFPAELNNRYFDRNFGVKGEVK